MRHTDKNGFMLDVWISDSDGASLPEYQTESYNSINVHHRTGRPITEPGISCWIPSVEGAEFSVNWQVQLPGHEDEDEEEPPDERDLADYPALQDLRCLIWLDGVQVSPGILQVDDILGGVIGTMAGENIVSETGELKERRYVFSRLVRTDNSEEMQPGEVEYLNEIEVGLQWGHAKLGEPPESALKQEKGGRVRKQDVKGNNDSFACLGPLTSCDFAAESFQFKPTRKESLWFTFFHAPASWLRAEGIAPPLPLIDLTSDSPDEASDPEDGPKPEPLDPTPQPNATNCIGQARSSERTTTPPRTPQPVGPKDSTDSNLPARRPSRSVEPRHSPSGTTSSAPLKRVRSEDIIDVDALSDSELQLDTPRDSKVNVVDSKPATSRGTRTRFFVGKVTRRRPRTNSGPDKRAKVEEGAGLKVEEDEELKLEEEDILSDEDGISAPLKEEIELDIELKQEDPS